MGEGRCFESSPGVRALAAQTAFFFLTGIEIPASHFSSPITNFRDSSWRRTSPIAPVYALIASIFFFTAQYPAVIVRTFAPIALIVMPPYPTIDQMNIERWGMCEDMGYK